jgi:hypothetical protein
LPPASPPAFRLPLSGLKNAYLVHIVKLDPKSVTRP